MPLIWIPLFFLSCLSSARAQSQSPAHFDVYVQPTVARPNETVSLSIDVRLDGDWHIYAPTTPPGGPVPTQFKVNTSPYFQRVGGVDQPPPEVVHDPNFDLKVAYFGKAVTFNLSLLLRDDAAPGTHPVTGAITYMLCNETACLPPIDHPFSTQLTIERGFARPKFTGVVAAVEPPPVQFEGLGSTADVGHAIEQGFWAFLSLSFTMGFLALLTPCVFPMVPITVSFFTKQGESDERRGSVVTRSIVYCGGIILTFTALGLVLASTLGASGAALFAANPWVNLLIALLFVVFALSLFGLFEIRLLPTLINRLNQSQAGGYMGILLMGFTFSLVSFTCTAPFAGTLLVLATKGTWTWPIAGMLAFSAAFALPFFFLSLFPQTLNALPSSGGWLNAVKVVMGFLELAAALKFVSNVDLVWNWGILSRELFLAVWIAIFALCSVYLLGKIRLPHDTPVETIGPFRLLSSVGCLAFSFYLALGLYGASLGELDAFFPPYGNQGNIAALRESARLEWGDDYEEGLAQAREQGKNLFIDFTGYACTNCRWMEANVFTDPGVRSLLNGYVLIQLYTDGQGKRYDQNRAFQEHKFGTVALPFYAVVSPEGDEVGRFPGMTRDIAKYRAFLDHGKARVRAAL